MSHPAQSVQFVSMKGVGTARPQFRPAGVQESGDEAVPTAPQRQWLQRIANQIKAETAVDRDAFDHGVFAANGGFTRLNKTFDGQLEAFVADFHDRIWQDVAA